jgi:twinkle protein
MAWNATPANGSQRSESGSFDQSQDGSTSAARSARGTPSTHTTGEPANSPSQSSPTAPCSGSATTANGAAALAITTEHAKRLRERGLDPTLCAQLGVHSLPGAIGFHYLLNGEVHNTKIRRGKGDMPWSRAGQKLTLWNLDCLADDPEPDEAVIITEGEFDAIACIQAGFSRVVSVPNGAQFGDNGFQYLYRGAEELLPDLDKFPSFVIATDGDAKGLLCRDALAMRLGDEKCRWVQYPPGCKDANDVLRDHGPAKLAVLIHNARSMWTEEVARMCDVPDAGEEQRYKLGIAELDHHGFRITLPAFWPIIGPYGSGKSVLLRQILVLLWQRYRWPCLLTSFEERVKPRYQRDLRRNLIGRPMLPDAPWTAGEIAQADDEIDRGFVFLQRAKGKVLDVERLLDRVEFAMRVYGVRVVAIDPVNEVRLNVPLGQSKTDYLGDFMIRFKDLCADYGALGICCGHVSKASADKRLSKKQILTLNDGEDTRHYGGKADIGWVVWRDVDGPTLLHIDKLKDHETMGRPTLVELRLDRGLNQFQVARMGYDVVGRSVKETAE